MDIFSNIGKFFGGLFGGGRDDDDERRRQQQSQSRPSTPQVDLTSHFSTPQQPASFLSIGQQTQPQQQRPNATTPVSGVNMDVQRAREQLKKNGSGFPYKPEVIAEAKRAEWQDIAPKKQATIAPININRIGPSMGTQKSAKDTSLFGAKIGEPVSAFTSAMQQGGGRVLDTAIQGGSAIEQLANFINPFVNEEQRNKLINQTSSSSDALRGGVQSLKDVRGNNITGNSDVDEAAGRIANGQGTVQDFAALAGRGLDVAGTSTMFLTPANIIRGFGSPSGTFGVIAPQVLRNANLYGGLEAAQAGLDTYGTTGDLGESLKSVLPAYLSGAATQGALEGGAHLISRGMRGNVGKMASRGIQPDVPTVRERPTVPTSETPRPITPETPREPISPTAPTVPRRDAISSPAQEAIIQQPRPEQQLPVTNMPEITTPNAPVLQQGVQAPVSQMPTIEPPVVRAPTPDEATAAAQKAIDEAKVEAPEPPAPMRSETVEAPQAAQARTLAQDATPINTDAVVAQAASEAVNKAPTEAIASQYRSPSRNGKAGVPGNAKVSYNTGDSTLDSVVNDSIIAHRGTAATAEARADALDEAGVTAAMRARIRDIATKNVDKQTGRISERGLSEIKKVLTRGDSAERPVVPKTQPTTPTKAVDSNNDASRVAAIDARTEAKLKAANDKLASQGTTYADLAVKLRRNQDGTRVSEVSAAERVAVSEIQDDLNKIAGKLNRLGLTDSDVRRIAQKEYLPTTKRDELTEVRGTEDVANRDFGFENTRKSPAKGLTDAQIREGAEQALKDYYRVGELVDDLTPAQVSRIKTQRRDEELKELIEVDGKGGDTGLRLSDDEIAKARAENERIASLENKQAELQKGSSEVERAANETELNDAIINKRADDFELLRKKTEAQIEANKRNPSLSKEDIKQKNTQLRAHLRDVRNGTYYAQSTVRTNLLFGVGRIADQVNKGAATIDDAITNPLATSRANKNFSKNNGRAMFADKSVSKSVWDGIKNDPRLNTAKNDAKIAERVLKSQDAGKGGATKAFQAWRLTGTRISNAGSRFKIAQKDTASYFVSKAQAEGITDIKGIQKYVKDSIGTKEWEGVRQQFFDSRNTFAGLPVAGSIKNPNTRFNLKNIIEDSLTNAGMSANMAENIADGASISLVGFPRMMLRLGARGLDDTTFGAVSFLKAKNIGTPKTEAEALKQALLIQQGFKGAQHTVQLGALGAMAGAAGMITGPYPKDASARARAKSEGFQPFSLKVGDQYIELGRYLGPLAAPFMAGGLVGSGQASPKDLGEMAVELAKQTSSNFGADSIGDVMEDIGGLMNGNKSVGDIAKRYGVGFMSSLAPASSALNTVGKATGLAQGKAAPDTSGGFIDAIMARFPITRDALPGKKDTLGNPIGQGSALNLLPGVSGGQGKMRSENKNTYINTVRDEIDRLAGLKLETMPSKNVENENSQRDAEAFVGTKMYKSADDNQKAEMLKTILSGKRFKDINTSVPSEQRLAMMEHALVGEKGQKKWLEDNDNALNYYSGNYNNLKANGQLSDKDDNLQEKSGARYKMVRAEVNKKVNADTKLQQLYDNTSESEWRKMIDPKSDEYDPATAEKLLKYDNARTKAGVSGKSSDTSKNKYTEKKKKTGSGRGRGRGGGRANGGKFAFASLPASLVGTGETGKYASDAPTFKPISDLKAPTKDVPRGRTISVKKGVSL